MSQHPMRKVIGWVYFAVMVFLTLWLAGVLHQKQKADKRWKQQLEMLGAVIEMAPEAIIITGNSGGDEVLYWNTAATRMLGWSETEIKGQSFLQIMPDQFIRNHMEMLNDSLIHARLLREPLSLNCDVQTKSGELRQVKIMVGATRAYPARYILRLQDPEKVRELGTFKLEP
jgi:PAS domain S-box-containing protein